MIAPHTYAEWATLIDAFGEKLDDAHVIPAMREGTLDWQAGVSERFTQRLVDAVDKRMNAALDCFQRGQRRSCTDERTTVRSLLTLRNEFVVIMNAIDIKALPDEHKAQYLALIKDQANEVQKTLEDSARRSDRSGRLLSLVQGTPVNKF